MDDGPVTTCAECGAALEGARACLDYFHDLLALEAEVPGAPGAEPHFLAVAAYNLQHPSGFMPAALAGLRRTLADVLEGRATVADARRRARYAAEGPVRVRRHAGAVPPGAERRVPDAWPATWAMTVRDVGAVAPGEYVGRVRAWARAVAADLDATPPTDAARAG